MDKKGKILIVEDDKTIREELQMTLMAADFRQWGRGASKNGI